MLERPVNVQLSNQVCWQFLLICNLLVYQFFFRSGQNLLYSYFADIFCRGRASLSIRNVCGPSMHSRGRRQMHRTGLYIPYLYCVSLLTLHRLILHRLRGQASFCIITMACKFIFKMMSLDLTWYCIFMHRSGQKLKTFLNGLGEFSQNKGHRTGVVLIDLMFKCYLYW